MFIKIQGCGYTSACLICFPDEKQGNYYLGKSGLTPRINDQSTISRLFHDAIALYWLAHHVIDENYHLYEKVFTLIKKVKAFLTNV
ncbi:hypothetical protein BLD44_000695 [Mastigocladus laminosus UU774]|nr:hypothetical protein BLD44_000695 [Mastigocladus laminosus UU774]